MIKAVIDTNVLVSAFWTKNRLSPIAAMREAEKIADDPDVPSYSSRKDLVRSLES